MIVRTLAPQSRSARHEQRTQTPLNTMIPRMSNTSRYRYTLHTLYRCERALTMQHSDRHANVNATTSQHQHEREMEEAAQHTPRDGRAQRYKLTNIHARYEHRHERVIDDRRTRIRLRSSKGNAILCHTMVRVRCFWQWQQIAGCTHNVMTVKQTVHACTQEHTLPQKCKSTNMSIHCCPHASMHQLSGGCNESPRHEEQH